MRGRTKPEGQIAVTKGRITTLLGKAEEVYGRNPELSHRYAEMVRKLAMRYNIRLTKHQKMEICSHCGHFLAWGRNAITRTSSKREAVIITCKDCGKISRYPYKRERQAAKTARKHINS